MAYLFLDESGDLGFDFVKRRTSSFFIVTILCVDQKRPIEKLVKKIHSGLRKKFIMRHSMLHAAKEEPITVLRFCRDVVGKDCKIMSIVIDKTLLSNEVRLQKHIFYTTVVSVLLHRMAQRGLLSKGKTIALIASRRETNKFLNRQFKEYLQHKLKTEHEIELRVEIKNPSAEKCLQAVDMVSWSIFRKYEFADNKYYSLLSEILVEEYYP